ncbi:MAG: Hsp20/alpha crystallin family protein [Rhodospirillales bacterium]|nr:Hsp20/alpha crystallin family protein [Rhodospirillales bacterium]MCW9039361.1 Hsp20/alpha crystallin family protein [Rhodospirillales bacterium]
MNSTEGRTPTHYGDNWWAGFFDPLRSLTARVADFFAPSSEASGDRDSYEISIELPGISEKDISIAVDHGSLMVSGEKHIERKEEGRTYYFSERSYGRFQRSFRLPADAEQDKIDATYKNGVLSIRIAKKKSGSAARSIPIRKG